MTYKDTEGPEGQPSPEQLRDSAAETARRYAEAIILGIEAPAWQKPTSTDTWIASYPVVPLLEVSDEGTFEWENDEDFTAIWGVNIYFVHSRWHKYHDPSGVLEEQLLTTEWKVSSAHPEKGIGYHPEIGTSVMIDGRYVRQQDTTIENWLDIIEHLGTIAEYMNIEILD